MSMSCADLDRFFDGELPDDAAATFRAHLAGCERCASVLRGRMQEELITDGADEGVARSGATASSPSRLDARRRTILYLAPILAAAAAAAAVIWLVGTQGTRRPPSIELSLAIEHGSAATRSSVAHVGDVLRPHVRGDGHRALWVYLGDRELVIACPGGAGCGDSDGELTLELRLSAPGQYAIIAIVSPEPIAPPQGALDVMLSAVTARRAHIKITHVDVN